MNYWWVNQNQTFQQEFNGGYMWSPKRNKNGARNQFYENMLLVRPGDLVFSFNKTRIPAIGQILSVARESPKPDEFGNAGAYWNSDGWRVDVEYQPIGNAIRPKDLIEQIRPTLPERYSPLQKNGDGLQSVYLAHVPDEMADVLLGNMHDEASWTVHKFSSRLKDYDLVEGTADRIEAEYFARSDVQKTEKVEFRKSRRGQGLFRKRVMIIEPTCRVTGVVNPGLLNASHMKPWAHCNTNDERLDGNNGLMLTPTIDHLFDKGFISFDNDGNLLFSKHLTAGDKALLNLDARMEAAPFSNEQISYLNYHRENILKS
jgi:putative restriction endonuclease